MKTLDLYIKINNLMISENYPSDYQERINAIQNLHKTLNLEVFFNETFHEFVDIVYLLRKKIKFLKEQPTLLILFQRSDEIQKNNEIIQKNISKSSKGSASTKPQSTFNKPHYTFTTPSFKPTPSRSDFKPTTSRSEPSSKPKSSKSSSMPQSAKYQRYKFSDSSYPHSKPSTFHESPKPSQNPEYCSEESNNKESQKIYPRVYTPEYLNYCNLLGVEKNCTEKEAKRAYLKLALKYHPDKNKDQNAAADFIKIQDAYTHIIEKIAYWKKWGFDSN